MVGRPRSVSAFLAVALVAGALAAGEAIAQVGKPTGVIKQITIMSDLSAKETRAKPGDTIVWHNAGMSMAIVSFKKGREVQAACAAPSGFQLLADGTYSSAPINPGGTASLCFVRPGTYEFLVYQPNAIGDFPPSTLTGKVAVE